MFGRSWAGEAPIQRVEVSTDGGHRWQSVPFVEDGPWVRWRLGWRPQTPGRRTLMARATDRSGNRQPTRSVTNPMGYLFGAVVRHQVVVV